MSTSLPRRPAARLGVPVLFAALALATGTAHAQTGVATIATYGPAPGDTSLYYTRLSNSALPNSGIAADPMHVRGIAALDVDGDRKKEIVATDYSSGGRIHVFKLTNGTRLELIWSSPKLINPVNNSTPRGLAVADLDSDGKPEILTVIQAPAATATAPANPNRGLNVFEYNGNGTWGNPIGTGPFYTSGATSVFDYEPVGAIPVEDIQVADVDGDGVAEVLIPNNGPNDYDEHVVVSLQSGDIGSGLEAFQVERRFFTRTSVNRPGDPGLGGGSAYIMVPADLDGDGRRNDIVMNAFNSFTTALGKATGPDTYSTPDPGSSFFTLFDSSHDDVSLRGPSVADFDKDGNQEVYLSTLNNGRLVVIDYPQGDPLTSITAANVRLLGPSDPSLRRASFGTAIGDLNGDSKPSVYIGSSGQPSSPTATARGYVVEYEYQGGPAGDSASYVVRSLYPGLNSDRDMLHRTIRDSAGVTLPIQYTSPGIFVADLDYLGDSNGNGRNELVLAYQSTPDSLVTLYQTYDATAARFVETRREVIANPNRQIIRVIEYDGTTAVAADAAPGRFALQQNSPNPFNPATSIGYELPAAGRVKLTVYDALGRAVATLVDDQQAAGVHRVAFNGSALPTGAYIYRLTVATAAGTRTTARQMMLVK